MTDDAPAFEEGCAEARRDMAAGHLRMFSGAPSGARWGQDLADSLWSHFGIEVTFTTCLVTQASLDFERGYNAVVEAYVNERYGKEALATVHQQVQERRKAAYDAWFAAKKHN